jgi:hypothetical protein
VLAKCAHAEDTKAPTVDDNLDDGADAPLVLRERLHTGETARRQLGLHLPINWTPYAVRTMILPEYATPASPGESARLRKRPNLSTHDTEFDKHGNTSSWMLPSSGAPSCSATV